MRLLIDLGNSHLKWAWQAPASAPSALQSPGSAVHQQGNCVALLEAVAEHQTTSVWLASVAGAAADRVCQDLAKLTAAPLQRALSPRQMDGISNAYAQPQRLGVDRFLAMLGARVRYPERSLVVVDAGTALTVDVLSAAGQHLGGSIAPGLGLMRRSLGLGTATLGAAEHPPLVALEQLGTDTVSAIECGILAAACASIRLRMDQQVGADPLLLITGGDGPRLASAVADGQVLPLLVLEGLARYADCVADESVT